jgi:hypothetical protein
MLIPPNANPNIPIGFERSTESAPEVGVSNHGRGL